MNSIGERLKWLRNDRNLKLEEVSEGSKVPIATLSRMENNQGRSYSDNILAIGNLYQASLEWILRGKGLPYLDLQIDLNPNLQELIEIYKLLDANSRCILHANAAFLLSSDYRDVFKKNLDKTMAPEPTNPFQEPNLVKEEKSVYLPILGTVAAGRPIMANELVEGFLPVPAKKVKKNTYIVKAEGASMIGAGINTGDLLIINPQPTVEQGEIALVRVDGNVTIKKFYRYEHQIRLKSANQAMKDIVVEDLTKVQVLGKVIGVVRAEEATEKIREEFNGPNE